MSMYWQNEQQRHAILYALETTKLYSFKIFREKYPHIFQHVDSNIRPAKTGRDYYVPPAIRDKCIVVEKMKFNRTGCLKISCFPFTQNLKSCDEDSETRWIRIGTGVSLACQPICHQQGMNHYDTEYRNEKCMLMNPNKKLFALLPESAFDQKSSYYKHYGLDVREGNLKVNKIYCKAYGTEFSGDDCYLPTGQIISEAVLGTSFFRGIFTARNADESSLVRLPEVPHEIRNESSWRNVRQRRQINPVASSPQLTHDLNIPALQEESKNIAIALSATYGIDLSVEVIAYTLRKRVPALLARGFTIPIRNAMGQAVLHSHLHAAIKLNSLLAKGLSVASLVLLIGSVVSLIVDSVDPMAFDNLLTRSILDKINLTLDVNYYNSETEHSVEITPEIFWNSIEDDMSEHYIYFAERVEEYLNALSQVPEVPSSEFLTVPESRSTFLKRRKEEPNKKWQRVFHSLLVIFVFLFSINVIQYIHYIAFSVFLTYIAYYHFYF